MPLEDQVVSFPFVAGMDQKTDPKLVSPPALANLVNAQFLKDGQISKRYGTTYEVGFSKARRLAKRGDEILVAGNNIVSYKSTGQNSDGASTAVVTREYVAQDMFGVQMGDIAYNATRNSFVMVWATQIPFRLTGIAGGDIYLKEVDATTGTVLTAPTKLNVAGTMTCPRVLMIGTTAIITYCDGTSIYGRTYTYPTATAETVLRNNLAAGLTYDSFATSATKFGIAYEATGAAPSLRFYEYDTSLGQTDTVTLAGEAATGSPAIAGYTELAASATQPKIYIAYSMGGDVRLFILNRTTHAIESGPTVLVTPTSSPTLIGICGNSTGNSACVVWSNDGATAIGMGATQVTYLAAITNLGRTWNVWPASKPFLPSGASVYHVFCWLESSIQGSFFLAEIDPTRAGANVGAFPVATIAPRQASQIGTFGVAGPASPIAYAHLPNVVANGTSVYTMLDISESADSKKPYGIERVTADYSHTYQKSFAEESGTTYFAGGMPSQWDGLLATEIGFLWYPEASVAAVGAASGAMAAGTYFYRFVYEYTNDQGHVEQSAPSPAYSVVCAANDSVVLTVKALNLTRRRLAARRISVAIYRTTVGGSTFYRLTYDAGYNILKNDTTLRTVTLTDTRADASIDGAGTLLNTRPVIYSAGGGNEAIVNVCPPSAGLVFKHKERIWLCRTDDPQGVWISNRHIQGEAPHFSEDMAFRVTQAAGGITAAAELDDKAILWSADATFVVYGDGPSENGQGSDLSDPVKLPAEIGCIEPRSVALIPDGLIFRSRVGFMLLTRSLEFVYIGAQVEDLAATYSTVSAAAVVASQDTVLLFCHAGGTTGIALAYDYRLKAWSQRQYYCTAQSVASVRIEDALVIGGTLRLLASTAAGGGQLYSETTASFLDGGSQWVAMTVETGWFKMAGIAGFQRVRRIQLLAQRMTAVIATINVGSDYESTYGYGWTQTPAFSAGSVVQVEVHVANQKCESVRVKYTDATPGGTSVGTGQGLLLVGAVFRVGVKKGTKRLYAANRG